MTKTKLAKLIEAHLKEYGCFDTVAVNQQNKNQTWMVVHQPMIPQNSWVIGTKYDNDGDVRYSAIQVVCDQGFTKKEIVHIAEHLKDAIRRDLYGVGIGEK